MRGNNTDNTNQNVYSSCANQDHEEFACERPKGHEGLHRALIGTDNKVEWGENL